jgi:hypothetical protein
MRVTTVWCRLFCFAIRITSTPQVSAQSADTMYTFMPRKREKEGGLIMASDSAMIPHLPFLFSTFSTGHFA